MADRDRYDCLRCDRSFLSKAALDRHYDRNPEHGERFVIDADAVETDATTLPGGEWIETDETVETFMTVADAGGTARDAPPSSESAPAAPDESSADDSSGADDAPVGVEMTYDPDDRRLVIHGIRDRELDLSGFWEAVDDSLTWSFDGTYHKIQFHKDGER